MKAAVGIFSSREQAERAAHSLRRDGATDERVSVLAPEHSAEIRDGVATEAMEQPGIGKALGGVVGGALGAAGGVQLGTAAATLLIPGIGPVVAMGIAGAALFGLGGAVGGAAAGQALETSLSEGLPKDELYVYEDALRAGRSVVIALAADDDQAERWRELMAAEGAESVDAARERWWLGLRSAEEEQYLGQGGDFTQDETHYRRGFEAALHPENRGKTYDESLERMRARYAESWDRQAFRKGYDRGQRYLSPGR